MRISDWSSDVCSSDLNAGTNVGVILTALFVPWIILTWGWEYSLIITGIIGFLLLFFWLKIYKRPEEHEKITKEELDLINSDADEKDNADVTKVPWAKLFKYRQTWAFAAGKIGREHV